MLFNRACKLIIGKAGETGLEFDETFKINFNIKKSIVSESKQNKIEIYNLSLDSVNKIKDVIRRNRDLIRAGKPQMILSLYAGYKENTGLELLYSADITSIATHKAAGSADMITTITCSDGGVVLKEGLISMSYSAGSSIKKALDDVSKELDMPIDINSSFPDTLNFANGFAYAGTCREAMNKISRQMRSHWTVESGKLRLHPVGGYTRDSVVVLSAESGMIGSPERLEAQGTDSDNAEAKHGWKVTSLLMPQLIPARRVKIESRDVNGIFIIDTVTHAGDTLDGDWQSTIETKEEQVL